MSDTETEVNATPEAVELAEEHGLDLSSVEGTGQDGKVLVDDVREALASGDGGEAGGPFVSDEVDFEVEELDFDELLPVVREGNWVRLKHADNIPRELFNRDLAVVSAPLRRTTGPSTQSNDRVEYQLPSDPVVVRSRDTREEFTVARSQVDVIETERANFGGR